MEQRTLSREEIHECEVLAKAIEGDKHAPKAAVGKQVVSLTSSFKFLRSYDVPWVLIFDRLSQIIPLLMAGNWQEALMALFGLKVEE